jgi:hypothetical protein
MIGGMPSPYGRAIVVAVFLFVLTLSSVSHATETNSLTTNVSIGIQSGPRIGIQKGPPFLTF